MKKFTCILLILMPVLASAKLPRSVVEQKYIALLAKSFTDPELSAPRTPLYWSLCLGETTALSNAELSTRIAGLSADSVARIAFYKRYNFYRCYSNVNNTSAIQTHFDVYLPVEKHPKSTDKDMTLVYPLSRDNTVVNWDDWLAYVQYINDLGDDPILTGQWQSYSTGGPDGAEKKVFSFVESQPQFPGGDDAMVHFLQSQIEYPQMERDNDIQGRVIVRFIVCPDGHVSNGEVLRSVSTGMDREAILMLKMMPRFKPGTQGGTPVAVYYNLPIVFRLQ